MDAMTTYRAFVDRWCHPRYRPTPVPLSELDGIETELGILFPLAYRSAMSEIGPASPSLTLLDAVIDADGALPSFNQLFAPDDIRGAIDWRRLGMPDRFVAVGNNGAGDLYCFSLEDDSASRADDAPIWLFDHELIYVEQRFPSFAVWISGYLSLPQAAS